MQIDWVHFTPWLSLGGGLLLGLACALFVLLNGRILGVSGILGGLLTPTRGGMAYRVSIGVIGCASVVCSDGTRRLVERASHRGQCDDCGDR